MADVVSSLPHINNIAAANGTSLWDPVHNANFEVYFDIPAALSSAFPEEGALLTQQVTEVTGLDALNKTTGQGSQKFFGVDVSYQNPAMDSTYCEFTITFNLNLRNQTDNWVHKLIRAWENLNYNLQDGTRTLKDFYTSDSVRIAEANRAGTVVRAFAFKHVLLCEVTGTDSLNYTNNDARVLQCKFRADVWTEEFAAATSN
jgi:hypothetical protein